MCSRLASRLSYEISRPSQLSDRVFLCRHSSTHHVAAASCLLLRVGHLTGGVVDAALAEALAERAGRSLARTPGFFAAAARLRETVWSIDMMGRKFCSYRHGSQAWRARLAYRASSMVRCLVWMDLKGCLEYRIASGITRGLVEDLGLLATKHYLQNHKPLYPSLTTSSRVWLVGWLN